MPFLYILPLILAGLGATAYYVDSIVSKVYAPTAKAALWADRYREGINSGLSVDDAVAFANNSVKKADLPEDNKLGSYILAATAGALGVWYVSTQQK